MEPENEEQVPASASVDPDQVEAVDSGDGRPADAHETPMITRPGSTRTSRVWLGSVFGLIVLIAILVFILQNLSSVAVHFPAATVKMPIGVAIESMHASSLSQEHSVA